MGGCDDSKRPALNMLLCEGVRELVGLNGTNDHTHTHRHNYRQRKRIHLTGQVLPGKKSVIFSMSSWSTTEVLIWFQHQPTLMKLLSSSSSSLSYHLDHVRNIAWRSMKVGVCVCTKNSLGFSRLVHWIEQTSRTTLLGAHSTLRQTFMCKFCHQILSFNPNYCVKWSYFTIKI